MKNYIVSQDRKTGLWYAHMRGYQHVPVSGSFSEKRRDAAEYAKMYNGLPHKVDEIERKRREAFEKEMEKSLRYSQAFFCCSVSKIKFLSVVIVWRQSAA